MARLDFNAVTARLKTWGWWRWAGLAMVALLAAVFWYARRAGPEGEIASFVARRGPLNISVLEGGSVRAVESQEVKCEVRVGYQGIKILKIVEEGYEVTSEDIRTNKVLVELDSSDLQKQIVQQDIQYESAAATLIDAQQNYEIQLNQNQSDIKAAEQKVRFARMDFDKFLGDQLTAEIIDHLGLENELAAEETNAAARASALVSTNSRPTTAAKSPAPSGPSGRASPAQRPLTPGGGGSGTGGAGGGQGTPGGAAQASTASPAPAQENGGPGKPGAIDEPASPSPEAPAAVAAAVDFSQYARIEVLGDGEAKQKLRKFEDDLQVAKKEEGQSKANLEGTKRLFEKGFVTRIDLEKDEIANENSRLKVQTAGTARDLFLKYEFSKTAEEALSKYTETVRELVRARKAAISKLAQAEAKLRSSQGQYNIQARNRKELYEQLDKCSIKATQPGLVVYGRGGDEMMFYGGEERIREGASVRERQSIITIPDMSKMSVRVKVHESYIKKVKKGEKAKVTVDAFPDKVLAGEVTQVGVLPDSQNMWMNPDMKVYLTTITLDGTNEWLKPGMSAKVEILVNRLEDVTYVPMQAVSAFEGKQVCYLANGGKPDRRVVEVGECNDEFIEIKSGLKPGEAVLLRPAGGVAAPEPAEQKAPAETAKATPRPGKA